MKTKLGGIVPANVDHCTRRMSTIGSAKLPRNVEPRKWAQLTVITPGEFEPLPISVFSGLCWLFVFGIDQQGTIPISAMNVTQVWSTGAHSSPDCNELRNPNRWIQDETQPTVVSYVKGTRCLGSVELVFVKRL